MPDDVSIFVSVITVCRVKLSTHEISVVNTFAGEWQIDLCEPDIATKYTWKIDYRFRMNASKSFRERIATNYKEWIDDAKKNNLYFHEIIF